MDDSANGGRWRWYLWLAVFLLWTIGLVIPDPLSREKKEPDVASLLFVAAKLVHLSAYAVLAAAAAYLPGRKPYWLLLILALHAPLTEWIQTYVPSREGSIRDVCVDLAGVAVGIVLT